METPSHHLFFDSKATDSRALLDLIEELALDGEIVLHDLELEPQSLAQLKDLGGEKGPALWTSEELIEGREGIESYLRDAVAEIYPELLERFDEIAAEVWLELKELIPAEFRPEIDRIEFIVMDEPSEDVIRSLPDDLAEYPEELCGLHVGTPMTRALVTDPSLEPVKVYLFRWALIDQLEPELEDPESMLREEIAVTLIHEIGHYFGLEEDDMERLGYD